jgi:hypothetical protein
MILLNSYLEFLASLVTSSVKHLTVIAKFIRWENLKVEILPLTIDQTKKSCLLLGFQYKIYLYPGQEEFFENCNNNQILIK